MIPNIKYIELLILSGLGLNKIINICKKLHLLCISKNEFNEIYASIMTNKTYNKQIARNKKNIIDKTPLILYKNVQKRLKYPAISKNIMSGLNHYILFNDVNELQFPEEVTNVLFNYKLRKFIELGKIIGLKFYELNIAWSIFNQTGIHHKSFDIFCHFFWEPSFLNRNTFEKKIEEFQLMNYYKDHLEMQYKNKDFFLASYGLQNINYYVKLLQNFYFQLNSHLKSNPYMQNEYMKLHTSLLKLINTIAKIPSQLEQRRLFPEPNPGANKAAVQLWKENHTYHYKKKYGIKLDEN